MFTLIENGQIYTPTPIGRHSVLIAGDRVVRIGGIDPRALDRLGVEWERIDAEGCYLVPGLIDPHAHLLGGSGEGSLTLASPMMFVDEIARAGVTTVVGLLGVDTTMKTIEGLLARVKALSEMGLTTRMWTGGYNVPPTTLLDTVRDDMMFVEEVIGAGEVAISDDRGLNQSAQELAKLVRDTHVGGLLTGKCGRTHFHVGTERTRLAPLRDIIEDFQVQCDWIFPTHIQRNAELLKEAIDLANAGSYVNMDVVEEDIHKWLRVYIDEGGPLERLSMCSDMDSSTPDIFYAQFCGLVVEHGYSLDMVLPLFTSNTAEALKLEGMGAIVEQNQADILILASDGLQIRHVIAKGNLVVRDGNVLVREKWLRESKRGVTLLGDENPAVRG